MSASVRTLASIERLGSGGVTSTEPGSAWRGLADGRMATAGQDHVRRGPCRPNPGVHAAVEPVGHDGDSPIRVRGAGFEAGPAPMCSRAARQPLRRARLGLLRATGPDPTYLLTADVLSGGASSASRTSLAG